ncbi:Predicted hydrolase of the alpha/beta superfamily [Slackia heliotrinireducens]|nr:Predicted hydrolase of the alpha/beta superfamily [Slackia heliotrinireducens]
MVMKKQSFDVEGKTATLYLGESENSPLVVLNTFTGDGASVVKAMRSLQAPDCSLLVVGNLRWDHDMTPWHCPPLSEDDTPCTGGAKDYLELLLGRIIPEARQTIGGSPAYTAIAGYSLAGLFAIWSMYQCGEFARVASMSGSLWFPDFVEYATARRTVRTPERLYLSLGDEEARTNNALLSTVADRNVALAKHYRRQGIDVTYELNPGDHYQDAALRSAKGIKAILA